MADNMPALVPPEPLRAAELGTFTHHSVVNRLPQIGRRLVEENDFPAWILERVMALLEEIPSAAIRQLHDDQAPDAPDWVSYIQPHRGQDWLQVPWFFAETYFYRRIMEAVGYYDHGDSGGLDPFAHQKSKGYSASRVGINASCEHLEQMVRRGFLGREGIAHFLRAGLWSNQADLSLWPVGSQADPTHTDGDQRQAYTLVDQAEEAAGYMFNLDLPVSRVDFLIDNAGFELVQDLTLTAALLELNISQQVFLHVKAHPTFVSDVIASDVRAAAALLASSEHENTAKAGARLVSQLEQGNLRVEDHFFWTSPLAMWQMPESLQQELAQSCLIVCKGDANYRRLLGDRHWPFDTPFEQIVSYLPASLVALRALKSEVACGLAPGQAGATAKVDPEWLTNGRWGVIQFAPAQ